MPSPESVQLREMLNNVKNAPPPATIEEQRARLEALNAGIPLPPDTVVEEVRVGNMAAEWVSAPHADPKRVILYLHGGGYVLGSLNTHRELVARLSAASGARGLVIAYRLAPEHPFPAAVEDAVAAYRWLVKEAGVRPEHIAISGDSAGGGLTLATLIVLRDASDPLPAAAAVLSPWTDLAGTGESVTTRAAQDPWLDPKGLIPAAQVYLNGADAQDPLASPLYADLTGLPPLLIQVGDDEILLNDSTRFAQRAQAADVPVTLEVWDSMWHVFQAFAYSLPEGREAIAKIGDFIREHISAR